MTLSPAMRTLRSTLSVLILPAALMAQEADSARSVGEPSPEPVVTHHQVRVDGETLRYTASAGYMPMTSEEGELEAKIFFIAYQLEDSDDMTRRPITFAFNGGPGSSSVWLHLGAIGPKRVHMTDEGWPTPPLYRLVDNEGTWLEFSDLVFIDPVTTGYSRPAPGAEKSRFHGLEEDIESVGEFIRLYVTRYERWSSPKYLAGESYGTTRASGLSRYLQGRHGMYLNGIVLVSAVLNFQTLRFQPGNDLPYVLFLPSYTATAWYHGKLPSDLGMDIEETLAAARTFALEEYAVALLKGSDLPETRRRAIIQVLARFTGLSEEYLDEQNLRVTQPEFVEELLRQEGQRTGRLDSRFTSRARDTGEGGFASDPSYAAIQGPYTAMLNAYVREELNYENDLPYEILTSRVRPWDWGSAGEGYPYVADDLRHALGQNPALRVLVANGYYDLATPFFATEYTFDHLGPDESLRERVEMHYYPAGHMMYIHEPSLRQLRSDVRAFVQRSLGGT